jgi:hypothetical protein
MIKQRLKVVAVAGVVVLALTGFSRHGGHGHSSGGGGGGCSGPSHTSGSGTSDGTGGSYGSGSDTDTDTDSSYGSGSDTGTGSGSYDDDGGLPTSTQGSRYGSNNRPTHGPTTTSSDGGGAAASATAKTLSCASPAGDGGKAVTSSRVQVTASTYNGGTARFDVDVLFVGSGSAAVDSGTASVSLKPGQTKTVTVPMNTPSQVSRVETCEASVV